MSQDQNNAGKLHRLAKLFMDTGEAATIQEAVEKLKGYRLGIYVDSGMRESPAYQAALLTAVNTGGRSFLGGVSVCGNLDVPLKVSWRRFGTLADAVADLRGTIVQDLDAAIPLISFSDELPNGWRGDFGIKAAVRSWSGGILPIDDKFEYSAQETFTPAGVLSGALAVSEAFQFARGSNSLAGHRSIGLSLWKPTQFSDWLNSDRGPALKSLPQKLWLIGLGNLGQAYLWTLGLLPYKVDGQMKDQVSLVLQDPDYLEDANFSTSVLTELEIVGRKKTRAMAEWCDEYGFQTTLIERKFADDFRINDDEPQLALCGVDNAEARAMLEGAGFKKIIESGLGKGTEEYLCFRMHTFPASKPAKAYWNQNISSDDADKLTLQPAYQDLHEQGLDQCGLTELAGRSVGAPFVGAVASTLVITEILRMLNGGDVMEVIDGDLRALPIVNSVVLNRTGVNVFNPGLVKV